MEYTTEQAKSIFTLVQQVSPYAFPLLLSLLFPLVWVTLKRLLGLYDKKEEVVQAVIPGNWINRTLRKINSWIKIQGARADQRVFVLSICLFVTGGILLKLGEYNENQIRQRALVLKAIYKSNNVLAIPMTTIVEKDKFDEDEIEIICSRFPREFVVMPEIEEEKGRTLRCVDSLFYEQYKARAFPLLADYLDYELSLGYNVDATTLLEGNNSVRNFFTNDILFDFLGDKRNEGKYFIYADSYVSKTKIRYVVKNKKGEILKSKNGFDSLVFKDTLIKTVNIIKRPATTTP